jgi:acetolactate synthase small subunit
MIMITTRRHDGILLSIAALFNRRGFALTGLGSRPCGEQLRVAIETPEVERLERIKAQLRALPDVLAVDDADREHRMETPRPPFEAAAAA